MFARLAQGWAALLAGVCLVSAAGGQGPTGLPAAPAAPPADKAAEKKSAPEAPPDIFANVPPTQPFPRPGYFFTFPTGEGCYSALDCLRGECSKAPPRYPYPRFGIIPPSFFNFDWRYLDKPDNTEFDYFDCLKRIRLCDDCLLFTTGGDIRYRFNHERNSRLLNTGRFAGRTNNYDLLRTRVYGDLMVEDWLRFYVEYIDARSPNYLLPPLVIDRDHSDLLNAFVDIRAGTVNDKPVWLRAGRQELLYGSQRLVSTLDWANTRRTFQGVKAFWQGEKWAVDAFAVQPVIPDPGRFDSVDNNAIFAGLWTTYKPDANQALDFYYLYLDRAGRAAGVLGRNNEPGGTNPSTFGARWAGTRGGWLWDVEGMLQFGEYSNQALFAQSVAVGGGYHWKDRPMAPMFWLGYDYASGDPTPGTGGVRRTFDQLFPFGHYYFGFIDVVGRRNIHDATAQLTFFPSKWVTAQVQSHVFWLAQRRDALYNAAGAAIRQDRTGRAGNFVGNEVDVLLNFHLSKHSDVFFSYSRLFAGEFIRKTGSTPGGRQSPDALYLAYSYRW